MRHAYVASLCLLFAAPGHAQEDASDTASPYYDGGGAAQYNTPGANTDPMIFYTEDGPVTVAPGAPSLAEDVVEPPHPVEVEPLPSLAGETMVRVAEAGEDGAGAAEDGNRVSDFLAGQPGARDGPAPGAPELRHLDEAGRAALADSLTAYYRYRETGFTHRRAVFDWQLLSSKIIFAVVIFLVLLGVYFSWLQFMAGHRASAADAKPDAPPAKPAEPADARSALGRLVTTIEAGTGGIKVSSPVLGVIILVISLAFFYLYLVHVYPVHEVF